MLEAAPKHIFSNDFVVRSSDRTLAVLDVSAWRERAEFELDGVPYRVYREGLLVGPFVLERAGAIIARAVKPSAFQARFEIEMDEQAYTLRKLSAFTRRFGIFDGDLKLGEIAPAGMFTRRTVLEVPTDWPVALQIYVFWLALVIWNRESGGD